MTSTDEGLPKLHVKNKVVIRKLPVSLSADDFWKLVDQTFANTHSWRYYMPGKQTGKNKVRYSKAFITFKQPEVHLMPFFKAFNGHIFIDSRGVEMKATVEYAPNQKSPPTTVVEMKPSVKEGTLLEDEHFKQFHEEWQKMVNSTSSSSSTAASSSGSVAAEVQLEKRVKEEASSKSAGVKKTTPLVEYYLLKKAGKIVDPAPTPGYTRILTKKQKRAAAKAESVAQKKKQRVSRRQAKKLSISKPTSMSDVSPTPTSAVAGGEVKPRRVIMLKSKVTPAAQPTPPPVPPSPFAESSTSSVQQTPSPSTAPAPARKKLTIIRK